MIVEHLPEGSATFRVRNPDTFRWNLAEQLLAAAVDALVTGNWLQSKDGQKNRNRPTPIERPGVTNAQRKRFGATAMSLAEADAWLGEGAYRETGNDLVT